MTKKEKNQEVSAEHAMYEDQKNFQIHLTERAEHREDYYRSIEYYKQNDDMYLDVGINFETRTIDIDSELNSDNVPVYKRAIRVLEHRDANAPIKIFISSVGGSVYDGLGLYGALITCSCPIYTFCEGYAMSMAVIIFLAGDIRDCYSESRFMVHEVAGGVRGKNFEIQADSKEIDELNSVLCKLLAKHTKKPVGFWKKETKYLDKFYTKNQASRLGILKRK